MPKAVFSTGNKNLQLHVPRNSDRTIVFLEGGNFLRCKLDTRSSFDKLEKRLDQNIFGLTNEILELGDRSCPDDGCRDA